MNIVGVSCFVHDAAAALVRDGVVVAAVDEACLSRDVGALVMPMRGINHCVSAGDMLLGDADYVVFHEKPFLRFMRFTRHLVRAWPWSLGKALEAFPLWLDARLAPAYALEQETGASPPALYVKQHHAHAASAFYPSPYEEAAFLTCDGVGEEACCTWGVGRGSTLHFERELLYPSSLGLFYAAVTEHLGLRPKRDEEVVTAWAATGDPGMRDRVLALFRLDEDGGFQLDASYFTFSSGRRLCSRRFDRSFGPPRAHGSPVEQRHRDLAASAQAALERVLLAMARHVRRRTGQRHLCLGGGVARNVDAVRLLEQESGFEAVYVPPQVGSNGAAAGAALAVAMATGCARPCTRAEIALGPAVSVPHTRRMLINARVSFEAVERAALAERWASLLCEHGAVAVAQGRMEWCHRPMGSRAIFVSPHDGSRIDAIASARGGVEPKAGLVLAVTREACDALLQESAPSAHPQATRTVRAERLDDMSGVIRGDRRVAVMAVSKDESPLLHDLLTTYAECAKRPPALAVMGLSTAHEPLANTPEDCLRIARKAGVSCLAIETLVADLRGASSSRSLAGTGNV